jgi:RES domain-containing protein
MPALYLSADHGTAIAEYMQALIHPGTLAPYDVDTDAILDLTDASVRASVGIDDAVLTLPWRRIRDVERLVPASWTLAKDAHAAGFDGCLVPSTQAKGVNLVLWRWDRAGAKVILVDPIGELKSRRD